MTAPQDHRPPVTVSHTDVPALLADLDRHKVEDGWATISINDLACTWCEQPWPCDAARARDALTEQADTIQRLEAHDRKLQQEHGRHSLALELHRARADQQTSRAVHAEKQLERWAHAAEVADAIDALRAAVQRVRDLCRDTRAYCSAERRDAPPWVDSVLAALDQPEDGQPSTCTDADMLKYVRGGYTAHGHWVGDGEPTEPKPDLVARCGGPVACHVCGMDAARIMSP